MPINVFTQASLTPDTGLLKSTEHEWQLLQNIRGWGNLMSRRKGVRNSVIMTAGVMGMHDLSIDEDPNSPDKILVTLSDGSVAILDYTEIFTAFTYLFSGASLLLQSTDLTWWNCTPDSNLTLSPVSVAAPGTTISTDLNIGQNDLFGFLDSTGVTQLGIDQFGSPTMRRYGLAGSETTYSSTQAFVTGVGPVFTDGKLGRHRLTIDSSGILTTTSI